MDLYTVSFRTLVLVCCLWCVELVLEEDEEGDTDRGQTQTRSSSDLKRNYYQTLGVQQTVTDKEVRRAFRKLAMKHHPDKNKSPDAENTFREMAEAYGVLSNKEKRSLYDHLGHEAFVRSEEESGGGGAPPEDHQDFFSFHQMFDHMFVFDQEEGEWEEGEEPFVGAGHWSTEGPGQHWSFPPTGGEDFWGSEFIDQGHQGDHYREEQQFCWLHPQADGSTITICEGG